MVIAVREDMTLERRADAVVILMTEMSAPVEDVGHPTPASALLLRVMSMRTAMTI